MQCCRKLLVRELNAAPVKLYTRVNVSFFFDCNDYICSLNNTFFKNKISPHSIVSYLQNQRNKYIRQCIYTYMFVCYAYIFLHIHAQICVHAAGCLNIAKCWQMNIDQLNCQFHDGVFWKYFCQPRMSIFGNISVCFWTQRMALTFIQKRLLQIYKVG